MPRDSTLDAVEGALLALVVVLPLCVCACVVCIVCSRQRHGFWPARKPDGCVEVLPTLSEDEETGSAGPPMARRRLCWRNRMQPLSCPLPVESEDVTGLTRCCFHREAGRRSGHAPVVIQLPLEGVSTLQEGASRSALRPAPTNPSQVPFSQRNAHHARPGQRATTPPYRPCSCPAPQTNCTSTQTNTHSTNLGLT